MTDTIQRVTSHDSTSPVEFDWMLGHHRPWLLVAEVAKPNALNCSADHVYNLIDDGSIDYAIDIRGEGATRPCVRICRESFYRFVREDATETNVSAFLEKHLKNLPLMMSAWQVASHLRCTDDHILNLCGEFTDIASAAAARACLRVSRPQLMAFIQKRRMV